MLLWKLFNTDNFQSKPETTVLEWFDPRVMGGNSNVYQSWDTNSGGQHNKYNYLYNGDPTFYRNLCYHSVL